MSIQVRINVVIINFTITLILIIVVSLWYWQAQEESLLAKLPINENMPVSWIPLEDVHLINIDGDEPLEYLLYFTYNSRADNSSIDFGSFDFSRIGIGGARTGYGGPVGAVIYNTETSTETVSDDTASGRLITSFIPYALLPSYRFATGQGFITEAEPQKKPTIETYFVTLLDGLPIRLTGGPVADAVVITDKSNYITWVWWQPHLNHYGVYQLHATGRFETPAMTPIQWSNWQTNPDAIRDIVVTHPLHDRSQICHRKRYLMTPLPERPVNYSEYDLGLSFCYGVPENAFYPEALVLAYLLEGKIAYWDDQPAMATEAFNQLIAPAAQSQLIRVDDMATYVAVYSNEPYPIPLEIRVCAEVIMTAEFDGPQTQPVELSDVLPKAALGVAVAEPMTTRFQRRWIYFTLRHEIPHRELASADRFSITNVEALAVSPPNGAVNCRQRLE